MSLIEKNYIRELDNKMDLSIESYIKRGKNGRTVVYSKGNPAWVPNPIILKEYQDDPNNTLFKQEFVKSKIYLPSEQEEAYKNELGITMGNFNNRANLILSMVGYSSLKNQTELGGVTTKQYEVFAIEVYQHMINEIKENFPNLKIVSIDGASDMGIDKALIECRKNNNLAGMSFSCPEYIRYVKDSGSPIFISETAKIYLNNFAIISDIMAVLGGRDAAFWKNYLVSEYSSLKKIAPVADPISSISGREDLLYEGVPTPYNIPQILNASKKIITGLDDMNIKPVEKIKEIKKRFSEEIIEYIKTSDIFKEAIR